MMVSHGTRIRTLCKQNMAEQAGLDYEEMMKKAEELHNQDPSVTIPKVTVMETGGHQRSQFVRDLLVLCRPLAHKLAPTRSRNMGHAYSAAGKSKDVSSVVLCFSLVRLSCALGFACLRIVR